MRKTRLDPRTQVPGPRGDAIDFLPDDIRDGNTGKSRRDGETEGANVDRLSSAERHRRNVAVQTVGTGDDPEREPQVVQVPSDRAEYTHHAHGARRVRDGEETRE